MANRSLWAQPLFDPAKWNEKKKKKVMTDGQLMKFLRDVLPPCDVCHGKPLSNEAICSQCGEKEGH